MSFGCVRVLSLEEDEELETIESVEVCAELGARLVSTNSVFPIVE